MAALKKKRPTTAAVLAEKLRVIAEAAPGLRASGVNRLHLGGDRIYLDPPAIEPAKRRREDDEDDEGEGSLLDASGFARRPRLRDKDD